MLQGARKIVIPCLAAVFLLAGCSGQQPDKPGPNPDPANKTGQNREQNNDRQDQKTEPEPKTLKEKLKAQSEIKKFTNLKEAREFFQNNTPVSGSYSRYGSAGSFDMMEKRAVTDTAPGGNDMLRGAPQREEATARSNAGSSDKPDFSKTNVQVKGVDEADVVKTDGDHIYALAQKDLFIVDARPAAEAEILAKIEFDNRPENIYVEGDRLAVFGRDREFRQTDIYQQFRRSNSYTFFKVFDISDRQNPAQVRDLELEGDYSDSRMIGDYVYFVTETRNYRYLEDEPVLPRILENGEAYSFDCQEGDKCLEPEIYYFAMPYDRYNYTSVTSINLQDQEEKPDTETYLLSGNQNMYVSLNNLYITYTKRMSEHELEMEVMRELVYPRLSESSQEKIAKIEEAEDFILTPREKRQKINAFIERYGQTLTEEEREKLQKDLEKAIKQKYEDIAAELEKTVIHKVGINEGELEYRTQGEVTGHVLNQFSMDERNGYFRIATTKSRQWSRYSESSKSYSNLYVLDQDLKQVGEVEKLAKGERIYSVRFMQDRAYMVTFKQIDPLFVIDLKDPEKPEVLGKLKIPGYSDYLHPYNQDLLIGLGRDTRANERGGVNRKGIKLSLFDVSNVSDPQQLDTYVIGDSSSNSAALHNHKAFLFSRDKNLLAIPVTLRNSRPIEPMPGRTKRMETDFRGAAVFTVTEDGFELRGKIEHGAGDGENRDHRRGYSYYDTTVKRSLYIGDALYTLSDKYLKMNELESLNKIKELELKKEDDDDYQVVN